jgi:hypothetical protein
MKRRQEDGALEGRFLMGLSSESMEKQITLARYWNNPPKISNLNNDFKYSGFNKNERAYYFEKNTDKTRSLTFDVLADEQSPLVNPVFIVNNWGSHKIQLQIEEEIMKPGIDFRFDHRKTFNGKDLIVWFKYQSANPISLSIKSIQ